MFQSIESMRRAMEATQHELDIIRDRGWSAWEDYYEAFLDAEHRESYVSTLEAQLGLLQRELTRRLGGVA